MNRGESPVKQALREILRLKAELAEARARAAEPIAIVGVGVRLPGGVGSPEAFWEMLASGVDAVGPIPRDRWDHDAFFDEDADAEGRYYVRQGGFLADVDRFDPEFFGIAPVEALTLDPQQRLLLETTWEALEHAGISPRSLHGSRTGVFVGLGANDYQRLVLADRAPDTYAATGTSFSVAAGRLSYVLGLTGPAVALDTACSASLVAVHLACQSLRRGESTLALAGGVSLMLTPELTVNFCRARMLSRDGRCKTFDAAADGYVRSEGCATVVLKRLRDAERDGDRIIAVIRGSAINQDGRSSGLTAPNGPSQEAVLRAALADAGLGPAAVSYVEAHGTGTSLGDPIEVQALGAVYGAGRPADEPLLIGSVKTNLGHLEAAAGITGLIKAALSLQQGVIPPHLHFQQPNPLIPWDGLNVAVPTAKLRLPSGGEPHRAGVSAFGFSGTNAHVVLEAPPRRDGAPATQRSAELVLLSAPQAEPLRELARRYQARLAGMPDLAAAARTTVGGRSHFAERLALVAPDGATAAAALGQWLESGAATDVLAGTATAAPAVALALPESRRLDASRVRRLRQDSAVFATALQQCADVLHTRDIPLLDALDRWAAEPDATRDPVHAAVAHVAVQYALASLWRELGAAPVVVTGEGLGEYAAALIAGSLGLEDALALAAARARDIARQEDEPWADAEATELEDALSQASLHPATRAQVVSGVTGATLAPAALAQPAYWLRQQRERREPARFAAALAALPAAGARAVVLLSLDASLPEVPDGLLAVGGGLHAEDPWASLMRALATLYVHGLEPAAGGLAAATPVPPAVLPTYPFQKRRFWFESRDPRGTAAPTPAAADTDPWDSVQAAAAERATLVPMGMDIRSYGNKWDVLNRLSSTLGRNALVRLGAFADSGQVSAERIITDHGVRPAYRLIVQRWLEDLARAGEIQHTEAGFSVAAPLGTVDDTALWAEFDRVMADDPPLMAYVRHSAGLLEGVLSGRTNALETLFPDGSFDLAADLYHNAVLLRYVNGIAAAAVSAYVAVRPSDAPLRVLEIGAGTGGTTASLLRVLPGVRTDYLYTDVSDIFLDWAGQRFSAVPFLRTGRFDLEQEPGTQGVAEGAWDIVVAANVIHAARDIRAAVGRARALLRPGGLLVLVESTGHHPWHDITTGLIEGWQHFQDDLRTDTPLLEPSSWEALLAGSGFSQVAVLPGEDSVAGVLKQHVILSQADGQAYGTAVRQVAAPAAERAAGERSATADASFLASVADAAESEREELVTAAVRECVMEVLRSDPSRPPARDARLMDLGLDSLMAVRLRNRLQQRLGLADALPATLAFDYPTIRQIARYILGRDLSRDDLAPPAEAAGVAPGLGGGARVEVAALSDAEVEAMLLERLEELQ